MSAPTVLSPTWRQDALAIIERLFAETAPARWDDLLDLRGAILSGADWTRTLDLFQLCRDRLEADHYLPFYRLRRLLATSLRLEIILADGRRHPVSAHYLRHNSLRTFRAALRRDAFEHDLDSTDHSPIEFEIIEAA